MEMLTLVQTRKLQKKIIIVLYGSAFWKEIINFDALVKYGTISPEDLKLFEFADDPETALAHSQGRSDAPLPRARAAAAREGNARHREVRGPALEPPGGPGVKCPGHGIQAICRPPTADAPRLVRPSRRRARGQPLRVTSAYSGPRKICRWRPPPDALGQGALPRRVVRQAAAGAGGIPAVGRAHRMAAARWRGRSSPWPPAGCSIASRASCGAKAKAASPRACSAFSSSSGFRRR